MELYGIWSSSVKGLCSTVSDQFRLDPAQQNEGLSGGIKAMWNNLEMIISDIEQLARDGEHGHQPGVALGNSASPLEHENSMLDNCFENSAVDGLLERYD